MTRTSSEFIERSSPLRTVSGASIPLVGVELRGEVVGGHARLSVLQRYRHDEPRPVEAVYVFPLPSEAAVTGFAMEVVGRRFEARVMEREEAFRAYDDAVVSGHGAALLEQERPNVFTANVGNLLPGEEVRIEVALVTKLHGDEGALRLSVPTLVAPRYIPGDPSGDRTAHGTADPTSRVPDADRISPPVGRTDDTLSVDLTLHFDAETRISSPSHNLEAVHDGSAWRVSLEGAPLDRDLVILVEPEERTSLERVVAHRIDDTPGYVALTYVPDLELRGTLNRGEGRTFSFVLDRSGSMGGASIAQAKHALRLCLRQLREGDLFEIVAFDDRMELFRPEPVQFSESTLAQADAWLDAVQARGGTELLAPLVATAKRGGIVVVLTDGQVGNEAEILAAALEAAGREAIFYTFGIGTNVSDALLGDLARRTGGAMELVYPGERIDDKVVATFARAHAARVRSPVLDVDGIELEEIAPHRIPDLVDGEPWTILARYSRGGQATLTIRGTLGGLPFVHAFVAELPERAEVPLVPTLWARERVRDLEAMEVTGRRATAMKKRIVDIATTHGIASKYTSFVVVEKRAGERRATGAPVTRVIPVRAPHGWSMFDPRAMGPALLSAVATSAGSPMAPPPPYVAAFELMQKSSAPPPGRTSAPVPMAPSPAFSPRRESADAGGSPKGAASIASSPAPVGPTTELFSGQRASGLWDDDATSLALTNVALLSLLRDGVTSSHRIYGGNVRKAIEAVVARVADSELPTDERNTALLVAFLLATGRKTRALVLDAIRRHAPHLEARLSDEPALRDEMLAR